MSPEDVARLRGLLARATPGPWREADDGWIDADSDMVAYGSDNPRSVAINYGADANAALIVAAVNALPELLDAADERDALRARVEVLERALYDALFLVGGCIVEPSCGDCKYCNGVKALAAGEEP